MWTHTAQYIYITHAHKPPTQKCSTHQCAKHFQQKSIFTSMSVRSLCAVQSMCHARRPIRAPCIVHTSNSNSRRRCMACPIGLAVAYAVSTSTSSSFAAHHPLKIEHVSHKCLCVCFLCVASTLLPTSCGCKKQTHTQTRCLQCRHYTNTYQQISCFVRGRQKKLMYINRMCMYSAGASKDVDERQIVSGDTMCA